MMKLIENVKIQREIPIHPSSKRYIHEGYFKGNEDCEYKLVDKLWDEIYGLCIIHIYPEADTIDIHDGSMNGYMSCLFFRTIIYNVDKREMYDFGLHDGINVQTKCNIQHFKDMSTMITILEDCKIGNGTEFIVYPL